MIKHLVFQREHCHIIKLKDHLLCLQKILHRAINTWMWKTLTATVSVRYCAFHTAPKRPRAFTSRSWIGSRPLEGASWAWDRGSIVGTCKQSWTFRDHDSVEQVTKIAETRKQKRANKQKQLMCLAILTILWLVDMDISTTWNIFLNVRHELKGRLRLVR